MKEEIVVGKSYKTKLNITSSKQDKALRQLAGIYRFVFNQTTDYSWYRMTFNFRDKEKRLAPISLLKKAFDIDKKNYPFIKEADNGLINKAISNSANSFYRWHALRMHISQSFSSQKRYDFPAYLARKTEGMRFSSSGIKIFHDYIKVPKLGKIKLYEKGYLPQGERYKTVSFRHDGKDWWIQVELLDEKEVPRNQSGMHLWADFKEDGTLVTQDRVYENIINSDSYKKELKRLKKLSKKLGRQKKENTQIDCCGKRTVRTSRNMLKTRRRILQSKNKMDRIKKDYFQKVACELAKSKPSEVHLLSKRTISTQRQDYLTRVLRESSTNTFANMLAKKLRYSGAEIIRHTSPVDIDEHLCTSLSKADISVSS